jgi:hypothetical protein
MVQTFSGNEVFITQMPGVGFQSLNMFVNLFGQNSTFGLYKVVEVPPASSLVVSKIVPYSSYVLHMIAYASKGSSIKYLISIACAHMIAYASWKWDIAEVTI